jgi:hypothetical protein
MPADAPVMSAVLVFDIMVLRGVIIDGGRHD